MLVANNNHVFKQIQKQEEFFMPKYYDFQNDFLNVEMFS